MQHLEMISASCELKHSITDEKLRQGLSTMMVIKE